VSDLAQRVARLLGSRSVELEPAPGRGYTHARRVIARAPDGRVVFAKAAVDDLSAEWLRAELRIYEALRAPFLPAFLGSDDDGLPVLVLEDLSDAFWPPPWTAEGVDAVRAALEQVAATQAPPGLGPVPRDLLTEGWRVVAADPEPFLSVGLCGGDWLAASLPALVEAADAVPVDGDALVHFDVRSDNVALRDGRALLVDWNWAARGNALLDVVLWAPSLRAEGGPPPEEIVSGSGVGETASSIAGFWAARVGLPPPSTGPRVREVQLAQLRVALPWACRELGIATPEGR